jgi:septum formation protein
MPEKQTQFILASASPRRKELLERAGYHFKITTSAIDESAFDTVRTPPIDYAKTLAMAKAKDIAAQYPDMLVLGADTVVDCDGQIIGKPRDHRDAEAIVRKLFSKPHKVITGIALVRLADKTCVCAAELTTVYPKKMTDSQIAEHIRSKTWKGKAGAYAIQETGDQFVEKIQGSMSNVVGLPMELLEQLIKKLL